MDKQSCWDQNIPSCEAKQIQGTKTNNNVKRVTSNMGNYFCIKTPPAIIGWDFLGGICSHPFVFAAIACRTTTWQEKKRNSCPKKGTSPPAVAAGNTLDSIDSFSCLLLNFKLKPYKFTHNSMYRPDSRQHHCLALTVPITKKILSSPLSWWIIFWLEFYVKTLQVYAQ